MTSPRPGDSTALPPAPKPSARAAAILAYNKLQSRCPKRDTLASAKPIAYALLVDSIGDRAPAAKLPVSYDVCGLGSNSPFTAKFTLTKLRQKAPIGRQAPIIATEIETAAGPRSRKRYAFDMSKASPGSYRLDVDIVDKDKRPLTVSREFRITDK